MQITRVNIKRYRCLHDLTIDCDDLVALVGPNGSGKSAVLRAIDAFYDTRDRLTEDDFYNRDTSTPIEIAITYAGLDKGEVAEFGGYVRDGQLTVTKIIEQNKATYHGAKPAFPGFADMRAIDGKRERLNAYKELQQTYSELSPARSADAAEEALREWEQAHPGELVMLPDDGQFFGFRQVGQAKLERFTRFVFVPAVRDPEQDPADSRGSAIFELMELVVRSVLAQSKDFENFRERTQQKYAELISAENVPQLAELAGDLTDVLRQYVPSAAVFLGWLATEDLRLPMPKAEVKLVEDGFKAPVDRVGHGLQRAFILALLQSLVAAQAAARPPKQEEAEGTPPVQEELPDLILGVEEPCLCQHPSRQRRLAKVLLSLAEGRIPGVARRTQVIYCTHSPLFVDLARFDRVRRLSKVPNADGPELPLITQVSTNSLKEVAEKLQAAQDVGPAEPFTGASVMARMATLMTPWTNEGFFADVILLVEGPGDRAAILGTALRKKKDLEEMGISLIPCIGKSNIDRLYLAFAGLGIPTYIVFDGDKPKAKGGQANRILQRLMGVETVVDFPPTTVTDRYAIFEDTLDLLLKNTVGEKLFTETADHFMQELGYRDHDSCRKSPLFVQAVLTSAADRDISVQELEQIVSNAIALRPRPRAGARASEDQPPET